MAEYATLWQNWKAYIKPFDNREYQPPALYRIERRATGWFTHYTKPAGEVVADNHDLEFRITRVRRGGSVQIVQIKNAYNFVYDIGDIARLAKPGENAYEILKTEKRNDVSTMTIKFYEVVVDTTRRLPKLEEISEGARA